MILRPRGVLVVVGALLGVAGGLVYAWLIDPVKYIDTEPASLRTDYKADYVALIASAYAADRDLPRAVARLAALGDPNIGATVTALAQQAAAEGRELSVVHALAALAVSLGAGPTSAVAIYSPPPAATAIPTGLTPSSTQPAEASPTPTTTAIYVTPTRAVTPTPKAEYAFVGRQEVCDTALRAAPLIQVQVSDSGGDPVPGAEVRVVWSDGADHFFTGLKPQHGRGYGDFALTPGVAYTISLSAPGPAVEIVADGTCQAEDGTIYPSSWLVLFRHGAP